MTLSPASASARPWVSLGIVGGSVRHDPSFTDFRWDERPEPLWGAQALVGAGRFAGGMRVSRSHTTQALGLDDAADPGVSRTNWDLVGHGRLATLAGIECLAILAAGRHRVGYDPDFVETAGPSGPIRIEFTPVSGWGTSAGLGLRRAIAGPWAATVGVEHQRFAMDTAHRDGETIVVDRRTFGDWSARFELSWRNGR
jgi:hypothetical protein